MKKSKPFNQKVGIEIDVCAICIDEFSEEDGRLIAELNCDQRHIFHVECLIEWVKKSEHCPLCRQQISRNEISKGEDIILG